MQALLKKIDLGLKNMNLNYIIILALFSVFLLGLPNIYDLVYAVQILFVVFLLKFKINFQRLCLNVLAIIFLLIFIKDFNSFKIAFIISIILFSFDYGEKETIQRNNFSSILLAPMFFIVLLFVFAKPHLEDYHYDYKVIKETRSTVVKSYPEIEFKTPIRDRLGRIIENNIRIQIFKYQKAHKNSSSYIPPTRVGDQEYNTIYYNRYSFNNLDPNFAALIFLLVGLILSLEARSKTNFFLLIPEKKIGIFLMAIFIAIITVYTKSRLCIAFSCFYLIYVFFSPHLSIKKIFITYFFLNFLIIVMGHITVNSSVDALRMEAHNTSSELPLAKVFSENALLRLVKIFDHSNYVRFENYFSSYLIIINNFSLALFPDHTNEIIDITYNSSGFYGDLLITEERYHAHNLLMGSIKEFGLILTAVYHYNIFVMMKHEKFKAILFPVFFSCLFLGVQFYLIVHLIFLFSFKTQNNFKLMLDLFIKKKYQTYL